MKRIGKVSLALIAVLALTAMASAASASAARFVAGEYPASASVEDNPNMSFTMNGLSVTCFAAAGSPYGTASLSEATSSISVSPPASFSCSGKYAKSLKAEGCSFAYSASANTFALTGASCKLDLSLSSLTCTYRFAAQSVPATLTTEGSPSSIGVSVNSVLKYKLIEGSTGVCGPAEGAQTFTAGWRLKATKGGKQVSLSTSNLVGLFFNGITAQFGAELYPVSAVASQDAGTSHTFTINGITLTCTKATFYSNLSGPASILSAEASYPECSTVIAGLLKPVEIYMNGCYYQLHGSYPSAGAVDVACKNPGEAIEIKIFNKSGTQLCGYKAYAQEGKTGATYTTVGGEGIESGIGVNLNVSNLTVSVEYQSVLCGNHPTETVVYKGSSTFYH